MTPAKLQEIRRKAENGMCGPWYSEDVPPLLAEVERLTKERDEAREVAVLLVESLRFCTGQGPRPDPERSAEMGRRILAWPK